MKLLFLGILGFCSGFIISTGLVGLSITLSILPRYAGITHTGSQIPLYEDIAFLGIMFGNLFYLFRPSLPLGNPFLSIYGLFAGLYMGAWILSLAEVSNIIPILCRRIKLTNGVPYIIFSIAAAKTFASLYYFSHGWQ